MSSVHNPLASFQLSSTSPSLSSGDEIRRDSLRGKGSNLSYGVVWRRFLWVREGVGQMAHEGIAEVVVVNKERLFEITLLKPTPGKLW